MARVCDICGKGPRTGNRIVRHGLAKYKGGIGMHTTGINKRRYLPNLQRVRVKIDGTVGRRMVCTACIKQGKIVKA